MTVAALISLAPVEADRLGTLEATIESGLQTFHEVGSALLEIRDSRLYRDEFDTFENYCRARWGMSRMHAHRLIEATETVSRMYPIGYIPANEGQARELARADEADQVAVWQTVQAVHDGERVTATDIRSLVEVAKDVRASGAIDDGSGGMVPWHELPTERKVTLLKAAATEETYERLQRQKQHIRDHYDEHDARGHITPEAREARATESETDATTTVHTDVDRRPHVTHNSGNNEWYTPPEYIAAARTVMGGIDLDPASSPKANEIVQAPMFFTMEDDGLTRPWTGRVWLNPPYSGDLVARFVEKVVNSIRSGDVEQAVVLVNNATETGWFQLLAEHATSVAFPKGRIRYLDSDGRPRQSPLQGQAFLYFGPHREHFEAVFSAFGVTL